MPLPLIGVTSSRVLNKFGHPVFTVMEAYIRSLVDAGASPLVIPLGLPEDALASILTRLDGILFTGGGDVHPQVYHGNHYDQIKEMDNDRDRVELFLFQQARQQHKPFFGICRGLQLINVAMGGTLYEDLLDQRPGSIQHQYSEIQPRTFLAHSVRVVPGSLLNQILGEPTLQVNSLHHQGIRDLAEGVLPSAAAPDGVIEAFEVPGDGFGMAVQWHPEWLQEHPEMRSLFRAFVLASQPH